MAHVSLKAKLDKQIFNILLIAIKINPITSISRGLVSIKLFARLSLRQILSLSWTDSMYYLYPYPICIIFA